MGYVQVVCDGVQGEVESLVLGAVVVDCEVQEGCCFCGLVGVGGRVICRLTFVAEAVNESPCLGGECDVERVVRLRPRVAESEFTFGNLLDNCITLLENCKAQHYE